MRGRKVVRGRGGGEGGELGGRGAAQATNREVRPPGARGGRGRSAAYCDYPTLCAEITRRVAAVQHVKRVAA